LTGKDGPLANRLLLISKNLKTEHIRRVTKKMRRKRKKLRSLMDLKSGANQTETISLKTSMLKSGRSMTGKNSTG